MPDSLKELFELITSLQPFEKIEIKLKDNEAGNIVFTRTSTYRAEYKIVVDREQ